MRPALAQDEPRVVGRGDRQDASHIHGSAATRDLDPDVRAGPADRSRRAPASVVTMTTGTSGGRQTGMRQVEGAAGRHDDRRRLGGRDPETPSPQGQGVGRGALDLARGPLVGRCGPDRPRRRRGRHRPWPARVPITNRSGSKNPLISPPPDAPFGVERDHPIQRRHEVRDHGRSIVSQRDAQLAVIASAQPGPGTCHRAGRTRSCRPAPPQRVSSRARRTGRRSRRVVEAPVVVTSPRSSGGRRPAGR